MSSLIENLIQTLEQENTEYQELLQLSMEKTKIIVQGKPDELSKIVYREQAVVDRITKLEKARTETTKDIALVLNKAPDTLTLGTLAELLAGQKKESRALKDIHDRLSATLSRMVQVNDSNKALLEESVEMIQFEMNLLQSLKYAPATANYSGNEYSNDEVLENRSFDAKQ